MTIIWSMVPQIWSKTDIVFCHSGPFFALLLLYGPQKLEFWKNKKNTWRYYHLTNAYHKWQSHDVWFLRYGHGAHSNFCLKFQNIQGLLRTFLAFFQDKISRNSRTFQDKMKKWTISRKIKDNHVLQKNVLLICT